MANKPFYKAYVKERHILNPLRYILGKYNYRFFEEGKQPSGYKSELDILWDSIDLDTKDIHIDYAKGRKEKNTQTK